MPLLALAVGGTFTVWTALHQDIGLTNAARAGAVAAVQSMNTDLATVPLAFPHPAGVPTQPQLCKAAQAAQAAIAGEEALQLSQVDLNVAFAGCASSCTAADTNLCVTVTYAPYTFTTSAQGVYEFHITIDQRILPKVPIVSSVQVEARASEATK
jgi:Flp pilus assembly protein TadG